MTGAMPGHPNNWSFVANLTPELPYSVARGRILGGSTSLNGTYDIRARKRDFDRWVQLGNPEWTYEKVLPLYRKQERDLLYVLQGVAGALLMPNTLAILRATFAPAQLDRAVGIWGGSTAVATASGPILGGLLVQHVSRESIFLINAPLGVIALATTLAVVAESRDRSASKTFDLSGVGLLTGARETIIVPGAAVQMETDAEAQRLLRSELKSLQDAGIDANGDVVGNLGRHAEVAQLIADRAADRAAELIVLGAPSHAHLAGVPLDDVTSEVERRAASDVLTVHPTNGQPAGGDSRR